ncbi:hypothetical protein ACFL1D_05615, partial [Candidatus Omnitrophota bacterium]
MKKISSIILILSLGFLIYSNSLDGQFLLDDNKLVKNNASIKSWNRLSERLVRDIDPRRARQYRPVPLFTYALDYSLWKLDTRGYHLTNILVHVLTALALYWLVNILFKNNFLSLLTALFFLVHPVHTEAVCYISGRADLLVSLFMLLSIILYIKLLDARNPVFYLLMLAGCVLAVFSKENSLILPGLLLIYHYAFRKKVKFSAFIPALIITFIYTILRLIFSKSGSLGAVSQSTPIDRIPSFFFAITNYIRLLFLPLN